MVDQIYRMSKYSSSILSAETQELQHPLRVLQGVEMNIANLFLAPHIYWIINGSSLCHYIRLPYTHIMHILEVQTDQKFFLSSYKYLELGDGVGEYVKTYTYIYTGYFTLARIIRMRYLLKFTVYYILYDDDDESSAHFTYSRILCLSLFSRPKRKKKKTCIISRKKCDSFIWIFMCCCVVYTHCLSSSRVLEKKGVLFDGDKLHD